MYLGDASDFTPLDLAGSLAVNMGVTHLAANNSSFRVGIMKDKNGDVPAWADARLIGGAAAAIISQFFAAGKSTDPKNGTRCCCRSSWILRCY